MHIQKRLIFLLCTLTLTEARAYDSFHLEVSSRITGWNALYAIGVPDEMKARGEARLQKLAQDRCAPKAYRQLGDVDFSAGMSRPAIYTDSTSGEFECL